MRIGSHEIEPELIDTCRNHIYCFRILRWDEEDTPIYEIDQFTGEPERYIFEYEKTLEQKLIEAIKQSEILNVIIEDRKIVHIK
ncbi:MAG: hypothetical protein NWE99_03240 [Candidatus Bathyarchaeota archaeon]|nr:hypothetical protein [Candidatus Bathyarchaeota archaeon]